jgi:hypothetical protein
MPEVTINKSSFKKALKEGDETVEVFDPVRACVARVRRVGKSFFIEPAPGECYPITQCDAIINWATEMGRRMCRS